MLPELADWSSTLARRAEQLKQQQRAENRQRYLPVAANPDRYSSLQLQNFLRSTELNRKLQQIQAQQAQGAAEARRIASEK
ncbi:MAG: hypothetical protein ACK4NM_18940, partial [Hydrogenophaga sp.]